MAVTASENDDDDDSGFRRFAKAVLAAGLDKAGQAAALIWWAENREGKAAVSMDQICFYFEKARLPQPNRTRLESELKRTRYVHFAKDGRYRLTLQGIQEGDKLFEEFIKTETPEKFEPEINLKRCPYINDLDIAEAQKMSELYISLFCLENSLRRHIEQTLSRHLGADWWNLAASAQMKKKEEERRINEKQNKWIPTRSNLGPLYALDWADLITLVRKYEQHFKETIPDINFMHRFSDLGNLRNVVAHNGVIADPMQFRRVEIVLHDWAKQLGP